MADTADRKQERLKELRHEVFREIAGRTWVSWLVPIIVIVWFLAMIGGKDGLGLPESLDLTGGVQLVYQLNAEDAAAKGITTPEEKRKALERVQEVFLLRLRRFDLSELTVRPLGDDKITIEVPGMETIDRVKDNLLGGAGVLTFRLVLDGPKPLEAYPKRLRWSCFAHRDSKDYYRLTRPLLDASHINYRSTRVDFGENGAPQILLGLRSGAAGSFAEITTEHYQKQLAICFDDQIVSAPVITARGIYQPVITGSFTTTQANELVKVLRAGPLPVSLNRISEVLISPALGIETRRCGFIALAVGVVFVVLLLFLAYTDYAAMLGTFLICLPLEGLLLYVSSRAGWVTLNMTSLSGLVVLMGISVDNLILFFEEYRNIREEADPDLKARAPLRAAQQAVDQLADAFRLEIPVILWANLTTIATLAPLWFLEGPIKDLVSVMVLGIGIAVAVNVYYARSLLKNIFFARSELAGLASRGAINEGWGKYLERLSPLHKPLFSLRFNLYAFRYPMLCVYLLTVAASIGVLATRGIQLGIDFKDLTQIVLLTGDDIDTDKLRSCAQDYFGERCQVKRLERAGKEQHKVFEYSVRVPRTAGTDIQESDGAPVKLGTVVTGDRTAEAFMETAQEQLDIQVEMGSIEMVGPSVIALNRVVTVVSAVIGLVLMTVFITIAYGGGYSVPVVAALILDGVITLGAISLLGVPLSIPVAAAILTIIGYSINDSIVLCGHIHPGRAQDADEPRRRSAGVQQTEGTGRGTVQAKASAPKQLPANYMEEILRKLSSRVLLTSLTTAGAALALCIFGRSILRDFGTVIAVGAVFGTISSVSIVVVALERRLRRGATPPQAEPEPASPTEAVAEQAVADGPQEQEPLR